MKFTVKPGCSFFIDSVKKTEGEVVELGSGKALKRYMHLVEPVEEDEEDEAPTDEKSEEKPARRRRSAASEDKADE